MSIHLSNEDIKRIIEAKPVGDFYPYNLEAYDYEAVDDYLSKVVGSFARIRNTKYETNFDNYGSGYASYVDVFCYKRDGSSSEQRDRILWIDGIRIYLCRLTPAAVIGRGQITKQQNGGSSDFISYNTVDLMPEGDWKEQLDGIKRTLESYRFTVLDKEYVSQPLSFDAEIPTILVDPPYRLFDALFYWED